MAEDARHEPEAEATPKTRIRTRRLGLMAAAVLAAGCGSLLGVDFDDAVAEGTLGPNAMTDAGAGSDSDSDAGGDGSGTTGDAGEDADPARPCPPKETLCAGRCGVLRACEALVECGGCTAPSVCGGSGTPNVCGVGACTPNCAGKACGASDGCGDVCRAGACGDGQRCVEGACACEGASCDTPNSRVLLFGGYTPNTSNEAWDWDGNAWTKLAVNGPIGRERHAMTTVGRRILLHGGFNGVLDNVSAEWDGTSWTLGSSASPSRAGHALAALGDRVILFGGQAAQGAVGDTWEWRAGAWAPKTRNGPSPRLCTAMATLNGKVVLFGGWDLTTFFDDTWEWDGTRWTKLNVVGPPARAAHVMATLNGKVVLFGGAQVGPQRLGDTWEWDGFSWTQKSSAAPPRAVLRPQPRLGAKLCSSAARTRPTRFSTTRGSGMGTRGRDARCPARVRVAGMRWQASPSARTNARERKRKVGACEEKAWCATRVRSRQQGALPRSARGLRDRREAGPHLCHDPTSSHTRAREGPRPGACARKRPPLRDEAVTRHAFNMHASLTVAADGDLGRERLCKYRLRPPFSLSRLRVLRDGRISYRVKKSIAARLALPDHDAGGVHREAVRAHTAAALPPHEIPRRPRAAREPPASCRAQDAGGHARRVPVGVIPEWRRGRAPAAAWRATTASRP
jgi:hypothetical protein